MNSGSLSPAFLGIPVETKLAEPREWGDEDLLQWIDAHDRDERDVIVAYQQAADQSPDPGVRYLIRLILEDERRHHALNQALSQELRQSLLWLDGQPAVPSIAARGAESRQLREATDNFLRIEQEGKRHLREAERMLGNRGGSPVRLLLELMERDTDKHIRILEHIRDSLDAR